MFLDILIKLVRHKFPKTPVISTQKLLYKLDGKEKIFLIDCRSKDEFAVSRIPGAIHLEFNAPFHKIKALLTSHETKSFIVPYCSIGYRSSILTNRINSYNSNRALNLEGSIFKWVKEDKPLVDSKNQELEVGSIDMFNLTWFVGGAITAFLVYCNLPPEWLLPPKNASLKYLKDTQLRKLTDSLYGKKGTIVKAEDLWAKKGAVIMVVRRPGCILCREEALEFMKIKSDLSALDIPLVGIVHEEEGAEEFAKRRIMLTGLLNFRFILKTFGAWRKGVSGNLEGDGSLLGGTFVMGPGSEGVLYEHRETYFGDHVNMTEVLSIAKSLKKTQ
ncbi:Peroxiredoxin-like 2A [Lepeophtheirus salmonis]|uniref:Peroxiredoxin-like 2A n=1 Tax=Lepeophtheirus salmonis TaxID=72036 RepID=A0A7R8HFE8_LEPSM|nr:Peroxiredoxin-like 2A [Lepeophtheirus salmonis]CAF3043264.1 Peroxiredoxin-like 2A [Lepeophtheirus salmonis]